MFLQIISMIFCIFLRESLGNKNHDPFAPLFSPNQFNISNIKTPQLLGIIFGCVVFLATISVVIYLLYASGTLSRAFAKWLTNVEIHPGATVGRRLFIDHALGVVIGETTVIGNDVTLYHGVTLGGTTWNKEKRHPTLGNNVLIGSGAKILGAITLGNNVRVGANSVVVKDVPHCCTVVGIPGRVIQSKGTKIQNKHGIDLDHHLVPDPVGKAIACLMERIDELEAKQSPLPTDTAQAECKTCEAESLCVSHPDIAIQLTSTVQ